MTPLMQSGFVAAWPKKLALQLIQMTTKSTLILSAWPDVLASALQWKSCAASLTHQTLRAQMLQK